MKIDIIISIFMQLLNKEIVTAKQLASEFEISTKTVYRYLSFLESSHIPLIYKSGRNGGIFLMNKFKLNNLFFTEQEKIELQKITHNIPNKYVMNSINHKLNNL